MAIEAYIRGKLPKLINWEDYLTSCVFESLYLLPASYTKNLLLNTAVNLHKKILNVDYSRQKCYFWPSFPLSNFHKCSDTIPDIILIVDNTAIIVEAKLFSPKSGRGILLEEMEKEELETRKQKEKKDRKFLIDQLGRDFLIGKELSAFSRRIKTIVSDNVNDFYVLYLTQHNVIPIKDLEDSVNSAADFKGIDRGWVTERFFWTNWQNIALAIKNMQLEDTRIETLILRNLYRLFKAKNLIPFDGFSFIFNYDIDNFRKRGNNIFYHYDHKNDSYFNFISDFNIKSFHDDKLTKFYQGGFYEKK